MIDPLDLRALKARVPLLQVLLARGVPMRRDGHRFHGPCPLHRGDNPRAFVVDPIRNLWFCFTRCGVGGDVIDLVRRLDGLGWHEALARLASLAGEPVAPGTLPPPRTTATFRPWVRSLDLDPDVPFLREKGIRPSTARRFEAGAWHRPGFLAGCIGVRLHDTTGSPVGYAGRRLRLDEVARYGKWKLPPGLPKRDVLFGAHHVPRDGSVTLVECPWGVMRLAQIGVPAVALLGTALAEPQRLWLVEQRCVILMLDGDAAGRSAAHRIQIQLARHVPVHLADLPDGCDPDDLPDQALITQLHPFLSL